MALDKVNNRLFVEHHGNSRYDIYQLDDDGLPLRRHAGLGIGRSLIGRGFAFAPMNTTALTNPGGASFDSVHQRMFVSDDLSLGPPAARILVFDLSPETLATLVRNELPPGWTCPAAQTCVTHRWTHNCRRAPNRSSRVMPRRN